MSIESPSESDINLMALNLCIYLASRGMYRGSAALLQRCSYKVHVGAVKIVINQRYRKLYKLSPSDYYGENINLVIELFDLLYNHYEQKRVSPTDTLITKIILGTLGCTMALDTRVKSSLGYSGVTQKFGRNHLEDMKRYYESNKLAIDEVVKTINNPRYHILKCVDMSFF